MRTTRSESSYAASLRRALRERYGHRLWMIKVHGGPFQAGGTPDFLLCLDGCFIAIELKRPQGKMTPRQQAVAADILAAGGEVLLVRTNEPIVEAIRRVELAKRAALSKMLLTRCGEAWEYPGPEGESSEVLVPEMRQEVPSSPSGSGQ